MGLTTTTASSFSDGPQLVQYEKANNTFELNRITVCTDDTNSIVGLQTTINVVDRNTLKVLKASVLKSIGQQLTKC